MKSLSISIGSLFAAISLLGCFPSFAGRAQLLDMCAGEGTFDLVDNASSSLTSEEMERINSSPMKNYFYNLRDNFGYNQIGSCGYVALGMLLTYYDSYYDDSMVKEQYDAEAEMVNYDEFDTASSPGSTEQSIAVVSNQSYIDTMIEDYSNVSLHANLIKVADSLGYANGDLGTTPDIVEDVLIEYLNDNNGIDESRWLINKYSNDNYTSYVPGENYTYSDMMADNVKEYLKLGIPVLLSIRGNSGGHVVVAYDYNEATDTIYANFGWHMSAYHEDIFSYGYNYIRGYITLNPYDLHTHCNNYIVDNVWTCSCSLPNHEHKFTYKSKSATLHTKSCTCGYSELESHIFNKRGTGANSKYVICGDCGYMKLSSGGEIIGPISPWD